MNDELLGRMWNDGHERFSADADTRIAAARTGLKRLAQALPDPAVHGLLMVAAVAASLGTLLIASPAGASAVTVGTAMVS